MSRLNRILADYPILKQAVESPDRVQHEKDFSSLAFAFLQDRAPGLLPYLLGFEVVDRDEDGSKAVGIFGFNISGHYYYVPAFFINAQIKGMDLLFSKTTNNFMPLQEEWIDKIINKANVRLGKPADSEAVQADFESPDLTNMVEPPIGSGKTASAKPTADESAESSYDAWNEMQKTAAKALESDKAFQEAFAGAVAAMSGKSLDKSASTAIIPFISSVGGPKTMEAFMRSMQNVKYANAFFEFYGDLKPFHVTKYAEDLAPKNVKPDLRVSENVQDVNADVPVEGRDRERARLITDGFAVIDNRKDSDKSIVYGDDMSGILQNPDEPGVYDVWRGTSEFKRTFVFRFLVGDFNGDSIFIDPSNKRYKIAECNRVIVSKKHDDSLESISQGLGALRSSAKYFIFDPDNGKGFVAKFSERRSSRLGHVFDVSYTSGLHGPGRSIDHETDGISFSPSESLEPVFDGQCECIGCSEQHLAISSLPSSKVHVSGDTIVVPKDFRVIELNDEYPYDLDLGSMAALDEQLAESGFSKIEVESDGVDYSIRVDDNVSDRLSKKEACVKLVYELGISVVDMDELIARADSRSSKPVLVKRAQLVGASVPYPMPPAPSADPITGMGLPMEQPYIENAQGEFYGVPGTQDPTQPGFAVGGQSEMEAGASGPQGVLPQDIVELTDQAAQSGQKHVFDHSTIAGLAGIYDMGYAIDMYVPELVKSLDRIGRILFIFYWKNDEFAERYGEQDLAGMEDLLRNVFKSFGSLVLRLQEKTIDGIREAE